MDYILDRNQDANSIIITFYSLIAMVSTYGGVFAGIVTVILIQANLTNIGGARLSITPLKKYNFLIAGFIVALTLNLFANGGCCLFLLNIF